MPADAGPLALMAERAGAVDVTQALALAVAMGQLGETRGLRHGRDLWEALATMASRDVGAARAAEPHLDAVGILAEAEHAPLGGTWGVFAAEGGADPLRATGTGGTWRLTGTKPWCSLAGQLDSALVTADAGGGRRLFAVSLRDAGVRPDQATWVARGLTEIPSGPVHFEQTRATPIGAEGWYLERAGFSWGGIGVAACWFGGAVGIARTVYAAAQKQPDNPFLMAHLGAIDDVLNSCRRALNEAAALVDAGADVDARLVAKRVRSCVARGCEEVIARSGHALGPGPLALDREHAKRVADLQLYVRQHHAERDDASLGRALVERSLPW